MLWGAEPPSARPSCNIEGLGLGRHPAHKLAHPSRPLSWLGRWTLSCLGEGIADGLREISGCAGWRAVCGG